MNRLDPNNPIIGVSQRIQETWVDIPKPSPGKYARAIKESVRWIMGIENAVKSVPADQINWKWVRQSLVALHRVSAQANYRAYDIIDPLNKMNRPDHKQRMKEAYALAVKEYNKLKRSKQS